MCLHRRLQAFTSHLCKLLTGPRLAGNYMWWCRYRPFLTVKAASSTFRERHLSSLQLSLLIIKLQLSNYQIILILKIKQSPVVMKVTWFTRSISLSITEPADVMCQWLKCSEFCFQVGVGNILHLHLEGVRPSWAPRTASVHFGIDSLSLKLCWRDGTNISKTLEKQPKNYYNCLEQHSKSK